MLKTARGTVLWYHPPHQTAIMKDLKLTTFELDGRPCALIAGPDPKYIIVQVTDAAEVEAISQADANAALQDPLAASTAQQGNPLVAQADLIRAAAGPNFALAVFGVRDWNRDLSPWDAPAVFAGQPFGHGAADTLEFLQSQFLPRIQELLSAAPAERTGNSAAPAEQQNDPAAALNSAAQPPVILAGYSLAGLFALWAAYQTDTFAGICAASPSVWFPGWVDFAKAATPRTRCVYLSLGDKEERARNPVMATVGDCIRAMAALLGSEPAAPAAVQPADPAFRSTLEWNPGNHFKDPEKRLAKGCIWAINVLSEP